MAEGGLCEAGDDAALNMSCLLMNGKYEVNWRLDGGETLPEILLRKMSV